MPQNYCFRPGQATGIDVISLIFGLITLTISIIVTVIGFKAIPKMTKLQPVFRRLLYLIGLSATIANLFFTLTSIGCMATSSKSFPIATQSIGWTFYTILGHCLLYTMILRLNHTFKQTAYALSKCSIIGLWISCGLTMITGYNACFVYFYSSINADFPIGTSGAGLISIVCYLITSIWGMYLFTHKLIVLSRNAASSLKDVHKKIDLNKQQKKIIGSVTKYTTLILVSLCITFSFHILIAMRAGFPDPSRYYDVVFIQLSIFTTRVDCVNVLLNMYLQYAFMQKQYDKYCKCFGCCCQKCYEHDNLKRMRSSISKKAVGASSITVTANYENTTTSSPNTGYTPDVDNDKQKKLQDFPSASKSSSGNNNNEDKQLHGTNNESTEMAMNNHINVNHHEQKSSVLNVDEVENMGNILDGIEEDGEDKELTAGMEHHE